MKISACAVIVEDKRVLVCQRRANDTFPNKWEFPGGKVEPGETAFEAVKREIMEELNVDVIVGEELADYVHVYPEPIGALMLRFFHVKRADPSQPFDFTQFQDHKWVGKHDLQHIDFLEGDLKVAGILEHFLPNSEEDCKTGTVVVHIAGELTDKGQACTRCGKVLIDAAETQNLLSNELHRRLLGHTPDSFVGDLQIHGQTAMTFTMARDAKEEDEVPCGKPV